MKQVKQVSAKFKDRTLVFIDTQKSYKKIENKSNNLESTEQNKKKHFNNSHFWPLVNPALLLKRLLQRLFQAKSFHGFFNFKEESQNIYLSDSK